MILKNLGGFQVRIAATTSRARTHNDDKDTIDEASTTGRQVGNLGI